jgi:hypothetical protein
MPDAFLPRESFLSFPLLSNNLKVKVHRTIILSAFLYGCGTQSPTLKEENRLRGFLNRLVRKIFRSNRRKAKRDRRNVSD